MLHPHFHEEEEEEEGQEWTVVQIIKTCSLAALSKLRFFHLKATRGAKIFIIKSILITDIYSVQAVIHCYCYGNTFD